MKKLISTGLIVFSLSFLDGCDDGDESQPSDPEASSNVTTNDEVAPIPEQSVDTPPVYNLLPTPGVDPLLLGIMRDVRFFVAEGDTARAIELLRQAIEIDNRHLEAHSLLFDLERDTGDDVSAAQTCGTIIAERLANGFELVQLEMNCAETHIHIGQLDEAERLARLAAEGAPGSLAPLVLLSGVLMERGNAQECVELLEGNIGHNRGLVELSAMSNLALAYAALDEFDSAISLLEEALSHNSYRTDLLLNLADVFRRAGRHEESRAVLERVLLIEPGNQQVQDLLDGLSGQ